MVSLYIGQLRRYVRDLGHVQTLVEDSVARIHLDCYDGQHNEESNSGLVITTSEDGGSTTVKKMMTLKSSVCSIGHASVLTWN